MPQTNQQQGRILFGANLDLAPTFFGAARFGADLGLAPTDLAPLGLAPTDLAPLGLAPSSFWRQFLFGAARFGAIFLLKDSVKYYLLYILTVRVMVYIAPVYLGTSFVYNQIFLTEF